MQKKLNNRNRTEQFRLLLMANFSKEDLFAMKNVIKTAVEGRKNMKSQLYWLDRGKTYYFRVRSYVLYTNSVTGKQTKSKKSTAEKAVNRATKSATSTLTKELTRSILGNLVK